MVSGTLTLPTKARKKAEAAESESEEVEEPQLQLPVAPRPVSGNFSHIQNKTAELIAEMTLDRDKLTEAIELLSEASAKMSSQ